MKIRKLITIIMTFAFAALNANVQTDLSEYVERYETDIAAIKTSIEHLRQQEMTNFTYNRMKFERIQFLLGDYKPTPATPPEEAETNPKRIAPQYMMAPNVRYLTDNEKIEATLARMRRADLNGLHIPWATDWYDFYAADYGELDNFEFNENCFEMLENVRRHCERDGVYLHVWIYGQESQNNALISVTGKYSAEEVALLKKINDTWKNKPYITFGLGFDLEEWVDVDYAKWVKSKLPDVKISMRHPGGLFNEIADIPSMMHRRFETADLEAFAAKYPEAEMIFSEDRCRNHDWDWGNDPYAPIYESGHFTPEEQNRVKADCKRLRICGIYGKLKGKDPRYGRGSAEL